MNIRINKQINHLGLDIGSTTLKAVILDDRDDIIYSIYRRHHSEILTTLKKTMSDAVEKLGNIPVDLLVTGSAGMGISEKFNLPFIQEVIASAKIVRQKYPQIRTLMDIGGEDAKIIFFDDHGRTDIRMNGSCAGGTGTFIDEMAVLLNVSISDLDQLARQHTMIYPMASRCGVFAKTDLQNLISRQVAREDIAASVFHAVVLQTLATLSRGRDILPCILFSGGPLTFLPSLKKTFIDALNLEPHHVLESENQILLPAWGAALSESPLKNPTSLSDVLYLLQKPQTTTSFSQNRHKSLFNSPEEYKNWQESCRKNTIECLDIKCSRDEILFLGIDSGSTTTKIVLMDINGKIIYDYYSGNGGNPVRAVHDGLTNIQRLFSTESQLPEIARSVVTGYGEDLIKAAFGIDAGMVETLAHYRAAKALDEKVTFILDIGGQDMKAIFVQDGHIENIEINEACSSGCGSFIESFAQAMGYSVAEFARLACDAAEPYDLGTRCTVFMNSRVKQALREGASIQDISAGLAYSIIKNALYKVLKITDTKLLGDHIVVQGGTFKNPAVHKALEEMIGKSVKCPDKAEMMGAYGAALTARDDHLQNMHRHSSFIGLDNISDIGKYQRKDIHCKGCENACLMTKLTFPNGNNYYSGNRCERIFTNGGNAERKGVNLPGWKYQKLFERENNPTTEPILNIGIPRVLNMFENFPFWNTLFIECGIKVHLSAPSSHTLYQSGATYIMSENVCFPAKLVSGHIIDLINADVDRIFYPMVFYEKNEFEDARNSYNCPIVSGYPDVIRSSIDPEKKYGIPFDIPPLTLNDEKLLNTFCIKYLKNLGIAGNVIKEALSKAHKMQSHFKELVQRKGKEIYEEAAHHKRPVVLLMGRPYHIDPLINHNIPELLTDFGVDVITEDAIIQPGKTLNNRYVMTQWEYVNRFFYAARWVGEHENVELVQLNSFGCGPDPFILDEVRAILAEYGKKPTVIRIDEVESPGSVRLRLRSMLESKKLRHQQTCFDPIPRKTTRTYQSEDRDRTLLVPDYSPFCSPPITRPFIDMGYQIVQVPPSDKHTVDIGLKYTNNEICYPGIVCIGDLVKALQSGKYDLSKTAIGFSQTGGQCRATSYPSMIKKALVAAGFENVPVVTLSTNFRVLNDQPGFKFNTREYTYKAAIGMMFTDALSQMYHSTVIHEKNTGSSKALADRYLNAFMNGSIPLKLSALLENLKSAVEDFNQIDIYQQSCPKVGIVGEIYVKYHEFSNNFAAQWLMSQGIEVVMPNFLEFFIGGMYSNQHAVSTNVRKKDVMWWIYQLGQKVIKIYFNRFETIMKSYRRFHPSHNIKDVANKAKEILSLNHQYGEYWLIAGEIASLMCDGVQNVLCLQPFGCIANHIIAKGVQKRMLEVYPRLNLLFLDADAGVSEVNFFNRLHFFIDQAKKTCDMQKRVDFSTPARHGISIH